MTQMYPLRFEPTFRRYLWGGRRLGEVLRKPIGEGDDYAESWEVVDHGDDQSIVAFGPLAGTSLGQLVQDHNQSLLGVGHDSIKQFPLLFKLLDCNRDLSVQVHPTDSQAALLDPPDLGKTEAWVILDARPGSKVYAGLKRGFDRETVSRELSRGTLELCLNAIEPRVGDCIFIPAGTVHALGAGLLVAEIQQSSDTTYRLFDWNRVGADGKPRQLHITESLDTIDFQAGPVGPQQPAATEDSLVERLVECDKFVLERCRFQQTHQLGGDGRFHIVSVIEGELQLSGDPSGQRLQYGQTALIPAACPPVTASSDSPVVLLDMYLPSPTT